MMRAALFALLMICAGFAAGQEQPEERHMKAYRERLAFYQAEGHTPEEIVTRMQNYFPWFATRFGVESDRDGTLRYYVAIGIGLETTFYAVIQQEEK